MFRLTLSSRVGAFLSVLTFVFFCFPHGSFSFSRCYLFSSLSLGASVLNVVAVMSSGILVSLSLFACASRSLH